MQINNSMIIKETLDCLISLTSHSCLHIVIYGYHMFLVLEKHFYLLCTLNLKHYPLSLNLLYTQVSKDTVMYLPPLLPPPKLDPPPEPPHPWLPPLSGWDRKNSSMYRWPVKSKVTLSGFVHFFRAKFKDFSRTFQDSILKFQGHCFI